jgi:hypothetical protein
MPKKGDALIFIKEVRQVLAELELLSNGATVRFDPSKSGGHAGSSAPTGEANPPYLTFRTRFEACGSARETLVVLDAARAELRALKCRTVPVVGLDGEELLRRQILEDHVGSTAADVAVVLYCTPSKVRKIRAGEGLEPDSGLPLLDLSEGEVERARRYAGQGVSERDIARFLCRSQSSVRRLLGRAA